MTHTDWTEKFLHQNKDGYWQWVDETGSLALKEHLTKEECRKALIEYANGIIYDLSL